MTQMLIDYYLAIEAGSIKMLDAAQAEDWDRVVQFEGVCAILIEQLRLKAATEVLLPDQRREKTRIMQRILLNDSQIRDLVEPWLSHFEQLGQRSTTLH